VKKKAKRKNEKYIVSELKGFPEMSAGAAGSAYPDNPEIIIFLGSNPADPYDLGGEIEFWLEDEKYDLTKSCFIWVPRNMKHCPMVIKRVDRPIIHLGSSVKPGYKI
jgi:hypothetical protein